MNIKTIAIGAALLLSAGVAKAELVYTDFLKEGDKGAFTDTRTGKPL